MCDCGCTTDYGYDSFDYGTAQVDVQVDAGFDASAVMGYGQPGTVDVTDYPTDPAVQADPNVWTDTTGWVDSMEQPTTYVVPDTTAVVGGEVSNPLIDALEIAPEGSPAFNTISNIIETQSHDAGIWFQPSHDIYGNPL